MTERSSAAIETIKTELAKVRRAIRVAQARAEESSFNPDERAWLALDIDKSRRMLDSLEQAGNANPGPAWNHLRVLEEPE
jgi:hypothetical protein